jgi:glycosyltransferase involved in cell wall biosynthesis
VVFNLSDLPIPTSVSQIYLFDWSYAVYPQSEVWHRMDVKSFLIRKSKLFFFKKYIHYPEIIVAQTETTKRRLKNMYGLTNINVVPNAVSLENMSGDNFRDFGLPENKTKFLYLTYYYPHKNIEIFLDLARTFRQRSDPYCIITTISSSQHKKAKKFLKAISDEGLEDYIINIGPVDMKDVPSLYRQTDALLMPTLLESFSGTYVESMFHGKTILTSDYDFSRDVCKNAAFYFNPLQSKSILETIDFACSNKDIRIKRIQEGNKNLEYLLTWEEAFQEFMRIIEESITYPKVQINYD